VFPVGIWYVLRMMSRPPSAAEPEVMHGVVRAAGITPAGGVAAKGVSSPV
jgi:hypothetical protein